MSKDKKAKRILPEVWNFPKIQQNFYFEFEELYRTYFQIDAEILNFGTVLVNS